MLILGFYIFKHHASSSYPAQSGVSVETYKIKYGQIPLSVQSVGTLVAAKSVKIAPEIPGQISKILFKDGSFVKAGAPLIQLNDEIYKVKANSVNADLTLSEATYHRMQILAKKGVISKQEIEKAYADLQEKKASATEANVMYGKMLLKAPFDGVVDKCLVSEGNFVSAGQELVTLTDTHHLHVEYSIPEKYLSSLKIGEVVNITTSAYPNKIFTANVAYIAPTINSQDRTIAMYANLANENESLLPGLFVNVTNKLGIKNNAILVPPLSLSATIDGQQVYKIVDDKAHAVPVVLGQRTETSVEVLEGLTLGDEIIVAGQFKVKEGVAVQVKS